MSTPNRPGLRQARRLYRLRTHPAWLEHLASGRYLSRAELDARDGRTFEGAEISEVNGFRA